MTFGQKHFSSISEISHQIVVETHEIFDQKHHTFVKVCEILEENDEILDINITFKQQH
jgi:hypothetical protein